MDLSETFHDLTTFTHLSTPVASPMDNHAPPSVSSPALDPLDFSTDNLWLNDISMEDLIGKKKDPESGSSNRDGGDELLCMTSEALFGIANSELSTANFDLTELIGIKPSKISPMQQLHYVVAPLKVEPTPVKAKATPTSTAISHRRKEALHPRVLQAFSSEEIDVKPTLCLPSSSRSASASVHNTRGRKRTYSNASSTDQFHTTKKVKKYEQDDNDPTVKNAKAAKANRDRKKEEFLRMKEESARKDLMIQELKKQLEQEQLQKEQLRKERDAERESNSMIRGVRGVATNIKEFIQCVIPPMNSTFGGMDVQIPDWFQSVSLQPGSGAIGVDPSVQERFNLQQNVDPSRYFSAHVNLSENIMKIEYDPQ